MIISTYLNIHTAVLSKKNELRLLSVPEKYIIRREIEVEYLAGPKRFFLPWWKGCTAKPLLGLYRGLGERREGWVSSHCGSAMAQQYEQGLTMNLQARASKAFNGLAGSTKDQHWKAKTSKD